MLAIFAIMLSYYARYNHIHIQCMERTWLGMVICPWAMETDHDLTQSES